MNTEIDKSTPGVLFVRRLLNHSIPEYLFSEEKYSFFSFSFLSAFSSPFPFVLLTCTANTVACMRVSFYIPSF